MTVSSDLIADDIEAYLERHANKSMLRFITCGSVDDGKSTLIGRLLYESKLVFDDQLTALEADSRKSGTQGGRGGSISRSWSTASPPNVSRASRSTSLPLLHDRATQVRRRRYSGARAVHPKHGDGRVDRRSCCDPCRFPQGDTDSDPPALVSGVVAGGDQARGACREQTRPRRLLARGLRCHYRGLRRVRSRDRSGRVRRHPDVGIHG